MRRYTDEQLLFLKEGFKSRRVPELTELFNERFEIEKTCSQIKSTLKNHGFKSGRKSGFAKGEKIRLLNAEQVEFLKLKYKKNSLADVTVMLNDKFGLSISVKQLRFFTKNHNITCGRNGRFAPGHKGWNAGTKGLCKPNSGSFVKGQTPCNKKPIGHERICAKDGYLLVKVDQKNPYTGKDGWYRFKHLVVWESHHGPVPDGKILRFKDGNKLNVFIDNLELVSKALHLTLNKKKFVDLPDELKPTVRAVSELEVKTYKKLKERANVNQRTV